MRKSFPSIAVYLQTKLLVKKVSHPITLYSLLKIFRLASTQRRGRKLREKVWGSWDTSTAKYRVSFQRYITRFNRIAFSENAKKLIFRRESCLARETGKQQKGFPKNRKTNAGRFHYGKKPSLRRKTSLRMPSIIVDVVADRTLKEMLQWSATGWNLMVHSAFQNHLNRRLPTGYTYPSFVIGEIGKWCVVNCCSPVFLCDSKTNIRY